MNKKKQAILAHIQQPVTSINVFPPLDLLCFVFLIMIDMIFSGYYMTGVTKNVWRYILKKCKGAIPNKGGKVIIIDMVVKSNKGDNKEVETQLFMDMLMMVVVAGKERNEKEWEKLFLAAGFTHYKITPALGLRSLIEVYPW